MSETEHSSSVLLRALMPLGVLILVAVACAIYLFYLQSNGPNGASGLKAPTAAPVGRSLGLPELAKPAASVAVASSAASLQFVPAEPPAALPVVQPYASASEFLGDLLSKNLKGLNERLVQQEFTRKLTIALYGLSEGRLLGQNRPILAPEGLFGVAKITDDPNAHYRLLPQNASRYEPYMALLDGLNSPLGLELYQKAYPLMQAAFDELGLGQRSFHQVVILAIDNLLAAPEVTGDLILTKPKMRYTFLDPELEKLPATHKLMLRIGLENSSRVKQHLRGLRQKLVALKY